MNRVDIVGRVCFIGELKKYPTQSGEFCVRRISVATNRGNEKPNFLSIECFGNNALNIEKYCVKGMFVGVEGHLSNESYKDREGNNKSVLKIVADKISFFGQKITVDYPKEEENEFANVGVSEQPLQWFDDDMKL